MDPKAKMEAVSTFTATYIPPKSPGVRLRGIRSERLEKHVTELISQKVKAEFEPPTPKMSDFRTTTRTDFCADGFVPAAPQPTQGLDYRTDQAITFWSENYQRLEGVTAVHSLTAPFRKSAKFSTPISERLNDLELPADS
ncbi:sperm-associated antigen 8 [Nelusetta ayraudi]|uniref:sperm-associated antigen 8 n=1 Tax=Nelusetta ayraudi TaxID=303726 RepID=UPI003F707CEC